MESLLQIVKRGLRRRKKETRRMRMIAAMAALFLAAALLLQDNLKVCQRQINYQRYGEWMFCQPDLPGGKQALSHPYLGKKGVMTRGAEIYNLERKGTGATFGWFDDNLLRMGHIGLYKGRMPQNESEIAMEYSLLAKMKCSYKIGSKVTFYYKRGTSGTDDFWDEKNEETSFKKVTFTLTGVLKNYTGRWSGGSMFPNALVTQKCFQQMDSSSDRLIFYSLKQEYENIDTDQLYQKFQQDLKKENERNNVDNWGFLLYNGEKYTQDDFLGDSRLYHSIEWLLLGIGSAILSYLMSAFLDRRKRAYYRLREMGATTFQVHMISLYECIWSSVPFALLGCVCGYALMAVINIPVSAFLDIDYYYVFQWSTLGKILLDIVVTLGVAILVAQCCLEAGRIQENTLLLQGKRLQRIRKLRKRRYHFLGVEREFLRRQRKIYRMQTWLMRGITAAIVVVALVCLSGVQTKYHYYRNIQNRYLEDISAYVTNDKYTTKGAIAGNLSLDVGISNAILEELRQIPQIRHMTLRTYDVKHAFSWEGKEESDIFRILTENEMGHIWNEKTESEQKEDILSYMNRMDKDVQMGRDVGEYGSVFYQDVEDLMDLLEQGDCRKRLDRQRLERGKDAILVIDTGLLANIYDNLEPQLMTELSEDSDTGEMDSGDRKSNSSREARARIRENTLHPGDSLSIQTKNGVVTVRIADVIYWSKDMSKQLKEALSYMRVTDLDGNCYFNLLGCEALGRQIAKADGEDYFYNQVSIMQHPARDYIGTQEQILQLFIGEQAEYETYEWRYEIWKEFLQTICLYGVFGSVIIAIFLMVLGCMLQERVDRQRNEETLLCKLGIAPERLKWMHILEGLQEAVWTWASLLPGLLMQVIWNRINHKRMYKEAGDLYYNTWKDEWKGLLFWKAPKWSLICIGLMFLCVFIVYWCVGRSKWREE